MAHRRDLNEIETWVRTMKPKKKLPIEDWKGSRLLVNDILEEESRTKFRSIEERLVFRLELWIDKCRLEHFRDGELTNGYGKFCSVKRRKKIRKPQTLPSENLKITPSKSCEDLQSPQRALKSMRQNDSARKRYIKRRRRSPMSPSYSANDLDSAMENIYSPEITAEQLDSPFNVENDEDERYSRKRSGGSPKRKFGFFSLSKKDVKNSRKAKVVNNRKEIERQKDIESTASNEREMKLIALPKIRPSLFDMESLSGSIADLADELSVAKCQLDEKKVFGARNKTLLKSAGVSDTLFSIVHNDSIRAKSMRSMVKYDCDLGSV